VTIEQQMSDGTWWPIYEITSKMATILDTPHQAVLRASVLADKFGTGSFEIAYQE
jgi:hypothetical protein